MHKNFPGFLSTEPFGTVLPHPLGHCHADTAAALQAHKKYTSFCALNVLKTELQAGDRAADADNAVESGTLK